MPLPSWRFCFRRCAAVIKIDLEIARIWGAFLAWKLIEESKENVERVSLDFPGAILLMVTCSLLIYATNQRPYVSWLDPSVIRILGLFVVSLALFIFVVRRARMPILDFALFKNRLFTASMFSLFSLYCRSVSPQSEARAEIRRSKTQRRT